ncbi:hypothetical protein EDD37DRAFT_612196 [Exophiala viscosa]|uniref:uncharacterized protein n=1 Tax=Exophiala viscosa TaxID=2486360 RepID=UPI00218F55B5|nr:hypothetical protein EDD37DRAFT_612196 [Exophiala viscosa]
MPTTRRAVKAPGHLNDIKEYGATQKDDNVSKKRSRDMDGDTTEEDLTVSAKRALDSDDDLTVTKKRKVHDSGGSWLFFKETVVKKRSGQGLKIKLKVAAPKDMTPTTKTETKVDVHQKSTESKMPVVDVTPDKRSTGKKRVWSDTDEETPASKKPKTAGCDEGHLDHKKPVNNDNQGKDQVQAIENVEVVIPVKKRVRPIVWDSDEDDWDVATSDNKRKRDADDDEENAAKKRRYDVVRPESDKENMRTKKTTKSSRKLAEPRTRKQSSVVLTDKQANAPGALKGQADKTTKNTKGQASKSTKRLNVARDEPKKTTKRGKRGKKEEPKPERLTTGQRRRFQKVKPDLRTPEEIEYSKTFGRRWD